MTLSVLHARPRRRPLGWRSRAAIVWAVMGAVLLLPAGVLEAKRRTPQPPPRPPDLRILNVVVSPEPFVLGTGPMQLTVDLELPADLPGNMILEVSSLISSPSKRSMRFLANRRTLASVSPAPAPDPPAPDGSKPRLEVTLSWDGTDQTHQPVRSGRYAYEVRAKLLSAGENGPPRTQMVSWPKRGNVMVTAGEPPPQ